MPNKSAQPGWIYPQAGVTETRPMIGATHVPEIVIWPLTASITTHVNNAAAAEATVLTRANAATPLKESKNRFFPYRERSH